MKHNFSDLLDEVFVDDIELNEKTLLSSRRIKARTMGKIGQKKTNTLRWLPRVAVIAAVIMALTLTALAAEDIADTIVDEGKLIANFFGKPLSKEQEEVVDSIGTTGGEVINTYGVTITPVAAIADDTLLYLQLRIEAPEGVVLPDVTGNGFYQFGNYGTYLDAGSAYCGMGQYSYRIVSITPLPDNDPSDNIKEFVIKVNCEGAMKFTDGVLKKLEFTSLWYHSDGKPFRTFHEVDPKCCTKLFEGKFEVCFNIEYDGNKLVLPTDGLVLYNEEFDFTTTVTRLIITPLSVTREFTFTTPNDKDILPTGGSIEIVFKDGSSVKTGDYSKYNFGVDAEYHLRSEFEKATGINLDNALVGEQEDLQEPIILEDIDYIVYAGKHIIDVN